MQQKGSSLTRFWDLYLKQLHKRHFSKNKRKELLGKNKYVAFTMKTCESKDPVFLFALGFSDKKREIWIKELLKEAPAIHNDMRTKARGKETKLLASLNAAKLDVSCFIFSKVFIRSEHSRDWKHKRNSKVCFFSYLFFYFHLSIFFSSDRVAECRNPCSLEMDRFFFFYDSGNSDTGCFFVYARWNDY